MRKFFKILLKLLGWTSVNGVMPDKKAIIIAVPHTSAWDFVYAYLYYMSVGGTVHIIIKKQFFFWPLGFFLKKFGAIPIDRSHGTPVVRQIIDTINKSDTFHLAIAPEGTRKRTTRWKGGFHTIAKATGATVYMGFLDYSKKRIGWEKTLPLAETSRESIKRAKEYYRTLDVKGKYPDQYTAEE